MPKKQKSKDVKKKSSGTDKTKKKLNFRTLESPFDPDFEKLTFDLNDKDISVYAYIDGSCYDNDTCSDAASYGDP